MEFISPEAYSKSSQVSVQAKLAGESYSKTCWKDSYIKISRVRVKAKQAM
jgi:hypothetical protein